MHELLGLPYSPWTEKARWALELRHVPYRFRHYQPLIGELALRVKVRKLTGRVTVPVLTTDDGAVLSESLDIARWADRRGDGPRLFPEDQVAEVERFVALSERGLAAGRTLALQRILADREALGEMVPKRMRRSFGGMGIRIARAGVARTVRKYAALGSSVDGDRRTLHAVLDEIRAALAKGPSHAAGRPQTLLGSLTFADVAVAQVLVNAEVPSSGIKMGPGSRRCFAEPGLMEKYADLVAWRDELYGTFRAS